MRTRADEPGEHPKLEQLWQGPAEIICKVSANTYANKQVCQWVG